MGEDASQRTGAVSCVGLQRRPHFLEGLGDGGDALGQRRVRHDRRRAELQREWWRRSEVEVVVEVVVARWQWQPVT